MRFSHRARTALAVAVALLLAVCHGIVLWRSVVATRLWEDEAFNLTVPVNLLAGLGYTSDGTLSGSTLTPFDPRISTGPVVLLPIAAVLSTGVDLVVGGRLIPAAYYVLLVAGLAVIGRRIGGRWSALVAAAVPLAFTAAALPSPIQGPADVLGEVPAAALLVWATLALSKRPWLAGLLIGLAIQAKYISLLAVPAFVLAVLLARHGVPLIRRILTLIVPALLVALPTAIVELFALVSLGRAGFVDHVRLTWEFLRNGGQTELRATIGEKLVVLASSWYLPPVVVMILALVILSVLAGGIVIVVRRARRRSVFTLLGDRRMTMLVVAAIGMATFMSWWLTAGHLPAWIRHPAPALLAFAPILLAAFVPSVRQLRTGPALARGLATVAAAALVVALAAQSTLAVSTSLTRDVALVDTQRQAAIKIAEADAEWIATVWGPRIAVVVLSGAHVALSDAPPENILGYPQLLVQQVSGCESADAIVASPYILCVP